MSGAAFDDGSSLAGDVDRGGGDRTGDRSSILSMWA